MPPQPPSTSNHNEPLLNDTAGPPSYSKAPGANDLLAFCQRHDLQKYYPALAQEELHPADLADCTDEDLKDIGIPLGGVKAIRRAATSTPLLSPTAPPPTNPEAPYQPPPSQPVLPPPPGQADPNTAFLQQQMLLQQQAQASQNAMMAGALSAKSNGAAQPVIINNNNNNSSNCGPVVVAGAAPPSFCCRLCCPICAVCMHEGCTCNVCGAFFFGCCFTLCCWQPVGCVVIR